MPWWHNSNGQGICAREHRFPNGITLWMHEQLSNRSNPHTHTRIHKMVKWKFLLTCGPRASNPLFFLVNTFSAYIFGFSFDCHRFHTIFGTIVQYKPFNMLTDCKESKWKRNKQPAYVSQTFLHRAIASSTLYYFTSLRSIFIFTNWILKYLKKRIFSTSPHRLQHFYITMGESERRKMREINRICMCVLCMRG